MNRKEIGQRLREAREKIGLSRDHVIALPEIEMSRSTLQQWEIGQTEPSLEKLAKLAQLYKVSPQWLIFGVGNSIATASAKHVIVTGEGSPEGGGAGDDGDDVASTSTISDNADSDDDYEDVPVYDLSASAGTGQFIFTENIKAHLKFPTWWFAERRLQVRGICGLYAKGDSMEPTIPNDALLLIDCSATYLADGRVYVVRIDDELYVKRINRLFGEGLELISDNPSYKPKVLSNKLLNEPNFFEIIGQVIHIGIDLPR